MPENKTHFMYSFSIGQFVPQDLMSKVPKNMFGLNIVIM